MLTLKSDIFIVCQKIYLCQCGTKFCLLLAWRFVCKLKRIKHCNAWESRQRTNEEDSIIDNFLTLFHKLCAFKCLTRKINKKRKKQKKICRWEMRRVTVVSCTIDMSVCCVCCVRKEKTRDHCVASEHIFGTVCFICIANGDDQLP